ncbi:MAG: hypothetical protein LBF94_03245 [Puniceicoccales bacterium]|jgi:hypothetical protein|nr:hypothetical protein [Puniceicoccales bacterium]
MERYVEYAGYKFNISHRFNLSCSREDPMPDFFGCRLLASEECKAVCTQGTSLMAELKSDLEKIPQAELSCRRVINTTYKSEVFQVFTHISKYRYDCDSWNESFAREMAHGVSKLMDVDYITASESNARLFCMLSCISFADIDATISDIDTTEISSDILRFIYVNPHRARPGEKSYSEVTITNLSDPENRTTSAKFVKTPTFEMDEVTLDGQLA